jgi:hypothetical protein
MWVSGEQQRRMSRTSHAARSFASRKSFCADFTDLKFLNEDVNIWLNPSAYVLPTKVKCTCIEQHM